MHSGLGLATLHFEQPSEWNARIRGGGCAGLDGAAGIVGFLGLKEKPNANQDTPPLVPSAIESFRMFGLL